MPSPINKKLLKNLALLARIELLPREEEKLQRDLERILAHFEKLKQLETSGTENAAGDISPKNVFRRDNERENTQHRLGTQAFPETKNGFLKIPPIFE